jgi:GTP cyclohydrolase I
VLSDAADFYVQKAAAVTPSAQEHAFCTRIQRLVDYAASRLGYRERVYERNANALFQAVKV